MRYRIFSVLLIMCTIGSLAQAQILGGIRKRLEQADKAADKDGKHQGHADGTGPIPPGKELF